MYIAINKNDKTDFHSFTWSEDNLVINGKIVNENDWEIVEVKILTANEEKEIGYNISENFD